MHANGGGFYDVYNLYDRKFDSLVAPKIIVIGNMTSQLYM